MDVTQENFEEVYEQISNLIKTATFVSIDTEFTGLDEGLKDYITCFDTPENRYHKLIKPTSEYIVVQFGLCLVSKRSNGSYEVRPYNFYIFPRPSRIVPDTKFSCQSSSLDFISRHGLDLGKVIKEGITYLKVSREKSYHDQLLLKHKQQHYKNHTNHGKQQQHNNPHHWCKENTTQSPSTPSSTLSSSTPSPTISPAHQAYVNKQIDSIEAFLQSSSDDILTLDQCSSYTRKSMYSVLQTRYADKLFVRGGGGGEGGVQVVKLKGPDHWRELQASVQKEDIDELNRLVGFTKVIKLLHHSGKLIVGHNMLVDLLHTLQQFWTDLPTDYNDFKHLLHLTFPLLADTKHLASTCHFKDISTNMNLESLEKDLKKASMVPAVIMETAQEHADLSTTTTTFHNASYDAYITASCYVRMKAYLELHCKDVSVDSFHNKLYLMRITDVPYINVVGDDLPMSREHMFHVQFSTDVKRHDLQNLLQPYGQFYLKFLNDTSAYVCLIDKQRASELKDVVCRDRRNGIKVESFMDHLRMVGEKEEEVVRGKEGEGVVLKRKANEGKKSKNSLAMKKKKKVAEQNSNSNNTSQSSNNVINKASKADAKTKNLIMKTLDFLKIAGEQDGLKGVTQLEVPDWD